MSEYLIEEQDNSKLSEFQSLSKIQAIIRGYHTRKFFYLFIDKAIVKDLDIFTSFTIFKTIFASQISHKILDYIEKVGMFFTSSDLAYKILSYAYLDNSHQLYYGELDKNGDPHQYGVAISNNFLYEGSWDQGKFHGKGRMIDIDNGIYNGDWNSGKKQGNVEMIYWNGNKYSGGWVCDLKSGYGVWDDEKEHYEGNFSNDMKNGYGEQKLIFENAYYEGNFVDGVYEGNGKFSKYQILYVGEFKKGAVHGKGVLKSNTWTYSGDFANNQRSGNGIFEDSNGKFKSEWKNDKPIGFYTCWAKDGEIKLGKWWNCSPVNFIDQILPNLYLGSAIIAINEPSLQRYGIKFIVRVLDEENVQLLSGFTYYYLKVKDNESEEIISRLDGALNFIKNCIEQNEKVIVHCYRGISRSAAVVITYMMKMQGMPYKEAYEFVKSKRPCINPNQGFIKQLQSLHY